MSAASRLRLNRVLSAVVAVALSSGVVAGTVSTPSVVWADPSGDNTLPDDVVSVILLNSLTGPNPVDPAIWAQVNKSFYLSLRQRLADPTTRPVFQAVYDKKVAALSHDRYAQLQERLKDPEFHKVLGGGLLETLHTSVTHNQLHLADATTPNFSTTQVVDATGRKISVNYWTPLVVAVTSDGGTSFPAGTGHEGNILGATGITTQLNNPSGVAIDVTGRLLIADSTNHRILAIAPDGSASVIAGTGHKGNILGATGTTTQLNNPRSVAIDAMGRVLITDSMNHRVLVIAPDGSVTVIAGTGKRGSSPAGTRATSAQLNFPHDVAIDVNGHVLIVDGYYEIRVLETWLRP
ncbi:MAG: hypothetical protein H0T78_10800 [Longispora sp.]|nr:hypothetical protein [Longispora sp. (in: high G+C Gram-positive bacteria)]